MAVMRGMREKGWLEFQYQNTKEPIRFPVGTVHGAQDGPVLAVLGGMHGSEFAGIQAAIQLFNEIDTARLCGTLRVCMIYNLPAFVNHLGFVVPHDGKNPMRTFPGSPIGTFSEAMAYYFDQAFLSQADYFIELHGGDIPEALAPFTIHPITGNSEVDGKCRAMSMAYNVAHVVARKFDPADPPHSAFGVTAMRGKPAILCESGQQGILNMDDVETHMVGLRNILIHLGMMQGPIVNTVKRLFIEEYTPIRSQLAGMWYPCVQLNDNVTKGQVVGFIRNYFGEELAPVHASLDGVISVIRTSPSVGVGNVLIEHGRVVDREE